ncbi:DUF6929 family protein [Chishuiella sp.]|uniref:DUF6929 family protein n=1 Tax=Chishuiella sp. TaxID=1969467 RepID=UPI0028A841A1|nr:hypothetical protein [Chishuiella sp.]
MLFYNVFLKFVFLINGLGAASGLVVHKNEVYAIADNDSNLYIYNLKNNSVDRIDLNPEISFDKINKKDKPDFESITKYGNDIYILGSGSKKNRFDLIAYNIKSKKVENLSYKELYNEFLKVSNLSEKDFNIEGVIASKRFTYLFNRGNGKSQINGIFKIHGKINDLKNKKIEFFPIQLPKLNNELTTFSDAILINNNKVLFTATVESSSTTQFDGEIKGSIIGEIDLDKMKLIHWEKISDDKKIEGLALLKKMNNKYSLYLCEDNDDDTKTSSIYNYDYIMNKK